MNTKTHHPTPTIKETGTTSASRHYEKWSQLSIAIAGLLVAGCGGISHKSPDIAPQAPQMLHYESHALPGSAVTTFDVVNGVVTKRKHGYEWDGRKPAIQRRSTPSDAEWERFWKVVANLRVWEWKQDYVDMNIDDGHGWNFSCRYDERRIEVFGGNAYPKLDQPKKQTSHSDSFDRLTEALERLVNSPR